MELSREKVCQLIDLYYERPVLWDQMLSDYKNKLKKNDAWCEISKIMNIDKADIEKKMKNVIGQFYRECRKTKSGAGTDEVMESKWFAFNSLMFLKDKNKPRETSAAGIEVVNNEMCTAEENEPLAINNEENNVKNQYECHTNTGNTANTSDELFITPKLPAQKNNKKIKKNSMAEEAYEVMKSLVSKQGQRDEYHVFGEHVGYKIRKLRTNYAKSTVEYLINNILYEAETGKYDLPPQQQYQYLQQPYNQSQYVSVPYQSCNIPSSSASSAVTRLASPTPTTPAPSFIDEDSFDEVLHSI